MTLSSMLFRLACEEPKTVESGKSTRPELDSNQARELEQFSRADDAALFALLGSSATGLTAARSEALLRTNGPNLVGHEAPPTDIRQLISRTANPLNGLLFGLAAVSFFLGDVRAAVVIAAMVILAITTAFIQEQRSNQAAAKLRALVKTTVSVKRPVPAGPSSSTDAADGYAELPIDELVPGDIVRMSAGDMIPADLRLLTAKDLYVNQSALTGESIPAEKHAIVPTVALSAFELPNICFMGANVVSGFATGIVLHTGDKTYFGKIATALSGERVLTSFDRGINRFVWLMIRFIAVMVPAVFLINGVTKGDWFQALLFAVAVAVGLTPEMLPMIVTVNLAKGALAMSRRRVIVKRLQAIQNFGAMDVLCTDKTGTLTQDRIILKQHLDVHGNPSTRVLEYAYLNSHFQSGLKNLLDVAVLQHVEIEAYLKPDHRYEKIDEIPFDFVRRRLSVVVKRDDGQHILICKGAVEEIFSVSTRYVASEESGPKETGMLDERHFAEAKDETRRLNSDGFRVVAVAYREISAPQATYAVADEKDLTLLGYIAFLDPPKDSAREAIAALTKAGVTVKILTGDNDVVTRKICGEVTLKVGRIVLGSEMAGLSQEVLAGLAQDTSVFAKVSPEQKADVIRALQYKGHVVGFMGDGINDSLALRAADVAISVDTAVDIAKESADIILLEKSLMVLRDGVIEGRKVFANINKYIKMGASSNFGNMFSVLGASIFLPFLPMVPIQVLANNLLYDLSQTAIPTDNVDDDYLAVPRRWDIGNITRFVFAIGPISSLFDYVTYGTLLIVFGAWTKPALFQTGWFVESLLTQTLIIHIIRTAKVPFFESRASNALLATTFVICLVGVTLPYTPVGAGLGLVPLPLLYWPIVAVIVLAYAVVTHLVKTWFVRRWGL